MYGSHFRSYFTANRTDPSVIDNIYERLVVNQYRSQVIVGSVANSIMLNIIEHLVAN